MKKKITLDTGKKVFPLIVMVIGLALMLAMWIVRLNMVAIVSVGYCCIVSAIVLLGLICKKKVYAPIIYGYAAACIGVIVYCVIWGADAGFGAFTSGLAGFNSADHPLMTGSGNFGTRLLGNILLGLPAAICLWGLYFTAKHTFKKEGVKKFLSAVLSLLLVGTSITYVLTMNMRSKPNTDRLWEGQDDYLGKIDKTANSQSPNVLFVLMDDLGYGDVSLNGSIFDTPNIDSIGENGLNFENFYSSYSVCSPARFACMTGRYPYRGYADNVIYPTVDSTSVFASTRVFNSVELGGNADGMLGDEITMAETFKSAGYTTGLFGKWHLGDYGEYLPTNQGFDYFYGSHYVNDMSPFYHVREENGQYTIARGTDELKDQSNATKWIHDEISNWITEQAKSDQPFFACYTSPWPHAPVFAGDDFDEAIVRYMRKKHNLLIGERTAEDIKIKIGTCFPLAQNETMDVRGRNLVTGLPKTVTVSSEETEEALREPTLQIVEAVHSVLEKTPPELAADVADRGIVLTGGGALLRGLEELIEDRTGINTMTADEPMTCVAIGTGKFVEFLAGKRDDD